MRFRSHVFSAALALLLVTVAAGPALSVSFSIDCGTETYDSVPLETPIREFFIDVSVVDDAFPMMVDVEVEFVLPVGWFGQWCQTSTGVCYFDDEQVEIPPGPNSDTIRVDFFPTGTDPGVGYIKISIRSVDDPREVYHCIHTLFYGLPVEQPQFTIDCNDNTVFSPAPEEIYELFAPLTNPTDEPLMLTVVPYLDLPETWFAQFCQTSTGVCYFDAATIEIPANTSDELRIDFFPFGTEGFGKFDIEMFAESNPSVFKWCYFRAYVGDFPADTPEEEAAPSLTRVWAEPNPFQSETALRLSLEDAGPAQLSIFGADGRLVRSFDRMELPAGLSAVRWDGRNDLGEQVATGVYYYRLEADGGRTGGMVIRSR